MNRHTDKQTVKFWRLNLVFRFLCWTNISHEKCTLVLIQNWNHKQACSLVHVYLIKMPIWFDFIHINKKFASTDPLLWYKNIPRIQHIFSLGAHADILAFSDFLTWGPYWHFQIFISKFTVGVSTPTWQNVLVKHWYPCSNKLQYRRFVLQRSDWYQRSWRSGQCQCV